MTRKNNVAKNIVPFSYPLSFFDVWEDIEREMRDSWRPFADTRMAPVLEMREEKGRLTIKAELPGIDKKDLDINLDGDTLTINAETKKDSAGDKKHRSRGSHYSRYFHAVTLPYPVKGDKVTATLNKGVLELKLPKAEEPTARKIEIKAEVPKIEAKKKETNKG
jgi:HSP20 family protein